MNCVWFPHQCWKVIKQVKLSKPHFSDVATLTSSPGSLPCWCLLSAWGDNTVLGHAMNTWAMQRTYAKNTSHLMCNTLSSWERPQHKKGPFLSICFEHEDTHLELITGPTGSWVWPVKLWVGRWNPRTPHASACTGLRVKKQLWVAKTGQFGVPHPRLFLERCCAEEVLLSCCPITPSSSMFLSAPFPTGFFFLITRSANYLVLLFILMLPLL